MGKNQKDFMEIKNYYSEITLPPELREMRRSSSKRLPRAD